MKEFNSIDFDEFRHLYREQFVFNLIIFYFQFLNTKTVTIKNLKKIIVSCRNCPIHTGFEL